MFVIYFSSLPALSLLLQRSTQEPLSVFSLSWHSQPQQSRSPEEGGKMDDMTKPGVSKMEALPTINAQPAETVRSNPATSAS